MTIGTCETRPTFVYVIMGNDYPDAVFATEEGAEAYIKSMKDNPRIYWRSYEFEVRS